MNAFLRAVAMLSLACMAVEMLLPTGATRKMCDMTLGLLIMQAMVRVLWMLLRGGGA